MRNILLIMMIAGVQVFAGTVKEEDTLNVRQLRNGAREEIRVFFNTHLEVMKDLDLTTAEGMEQARLIQNDLIADMLDVLAQTTFPELENSLIIFPGGGTGGSGGSSSPCDTACQQATAAASNAAAALSQLANNQCDVWAADAYSNLLSANGNLTNLKNTLCNSSSSCQYYYIGPAYEYAIRKLTSAMSNVSNSTCLSTSLKNSLLLLLSNAKIAAQNADYAAADCCPYY
jgi:hypothetical protein